MAFNPIKSVSGWFGTRAKPGEPAGPHRAAGILNFLRSIGAAYPGRKLLDKMPEREELTRSEKARTGPQGVVLPVFLPFIDNYTDETPEMRRVYRKMGYADAYVSSALKDIVYGVSSLEWTVKPAKTKKGEESLNKEVADFVEWQVQEGIRGGRHTISERVLYPGMIDGYSVNEPELQPVLSGKWTGKIRCCELKSKDVGEDLVPQFDEFRNIVGFLGLRYNGGKEFAPDGFIVYVNNSQFGVPVSECRQVYMPYWYQDTVEKLRAIFLQLRAAPIPYARYQTGTAESIRESIKNALANLKKNAYFVIPESVELAVLDIAMGAEAAYDKAISDYKHDKYQGITGSTLSALEGLVEDARGDTKVHKSTSQLRVVQKAAAVASLLNDDQNGFVKNVVDLNYVVSAYPTVSIEGVDVDELQADLAIVEGLSQLGYDVDEEQVQERFGWKVKRRKAQSPATPRQPAAIRFPTVGSGQRRTKAGRTEQRPCKAADSAAQAA